MPVPTLMPVPAKIVCVIDDDPSVRRSTGALIRSLGWGAAFFSSAEGFMAHPSHTAYDCLICDIALEAISGIELLRRLRAAGLHTPCIFVTANATSRCREQARKHGAVCMLDKPVDPDDLVGWLSRVLNTAP
ncbi:response regulator [Cupriavidus pauculus]